MVGRNPRQRQRPPHRRRPCAARHRRLQPHHILDEAGRHHFRSSQWYRTKNQGAHTHTLHLGFGSGSGFVCGINTGFGLCLRHSNELHPGALRSYFLQHYIEFAHESSEAQAQGVCDRLKGAVLLQVFQQERFKLY